MYEGSYMNATMLREQKCNNSGQQLLSEQTNVLTPQATLFCLKMVPDLKVFPVFLNGACVLKVPHNAYNPRLWHTITYFTLYLSFARLFHFKSRVSSFNFRRPPQLEI